MQSANSQFSPQTIVTKPLTYGLLTVAGLSGCFLLGFPFDNHNESFLWIVAFNKVTLSDTLTKQVIGIETFRPLGMATAWLSYHLSGNIYLQQLINWLFAVSSFLLLFFSASNKIVFSFISFITGACFFGGYIYLFHLHGVFYGPFQLYVSFLTVLAWRQSRLSLKMLGLLMAITVVISLYHTFALLVFCGFLAGYIFQPGKTLTKSAYIGLFVCLLLTLAFAKMILHAKELKTLQALADGLIVSYKMAEVVISVSVVATIFSVMTAITMVSKTPGKLALAACVILLSALFIYWHLPVLLIWVLVSAISMLASKRIEMATLIAATAILPLGSSSGSPTYVVFVLMICAFVTASAAIFEVPDFGWLRRLCLAGLLLFATGIIALRNGVRVPLLRSVAQPILAEQEKTKQFTKIIDWKLTNKNYESFQLLISDSWSLPVNSTNSVNRANRPVTSQSDLDEYLNFFSNGTYGKQKSNVLYVTFGDKILKDKNLVLSLEGKWNGRANVFQ